MEISEAFGIRDSVVIAHAAIKITFLIKFKLILIEYNMMHLYLHFILSGNTKLKFTNPCAHISNPALAFSPHVSLTDYLPLRFTAVYLNTG